MLSVIDAHTHLALHAERVAALSAQAARDRMVRDLVRARRARPTR